MKRNILSLIAIILFCACVFAEADTQYFDPSAQVSAKYLSMGDSAAAAGMGDAYMGVVTDAPSVFWNPAGLSNMQRENKDWSLFFDQNVWFQDMMASNMAVAKNFKNIGTFGFGVMYYNAGKQDRTGIDPNGNPIPASSLLGSYSPYAVVLNGAYSAIMEEGIDFGVNLKYIMDSIDGDLAQTLAFDVGVRYHFPFLKDLTLNIVAKNFGGRFNNEILAKEMVFAAAYTFNVADFKITGDYDICGDIDNIPLQKVGVEIKTPYLLVLRAGYQTDNTTVSGLKNIAFGCGVDISGKYADFAFEPFGDLGNAYKVSFGGDF